jgi:predicted RNA binding protein YcfA (HicA-like mRNA interferase family)
MPSEVRLAEVQRILEQHGFVLLRIKGSHHVFGKAGERPIIVPVHHGKVSYVYVRQVEKRIEGD